MEIIKPLFKDYEYGWYGFHGSFKGTFMTGAVCEMFVCYINKARTKFYDRSYYNNNLKALEEQLSKLKGVIFIHGNYKDILKSETHYKREAKTMEKLTIEYINPKSLKISEYNAKEHTEQQIAEIVQSIQKFGFSDVIGVDENDTTIFGAGRLLAAQKLDLDSVPIIRIKHLTEDQKRAYSIAHNKLTMNSDFNFEKLKSELEQLQVNEFDISLLGFNHEELGELLYNEAIPDENNIRSKKSKIHTCPQCGNVFED